MSTTESIPLSNGQIIETDALPYVDPAQVALRGASERILSPFGSFHDRPSTVEGMSRELFSSDDTLAVFEEAALVLDPTSVLGDEDVKACAQLAKGDFGRLTKSVDNISFAVHAALGLMQTYRNMRESVNELTTSREE